ncbi:hypothetical protein MKEN_01075100 [Mycena kentingensis (nom. inval.)]|nr:hypothetical protein MKEN_01075100 [Mycena kentingensis (nom. inval.)]
MPLFASLLRQTRPLARNAVGIRLNSTVATGSTPTWTEYFALRKRRRLFQTACIAPCAGFGFLGGSFYFGSLETDPTKPIFGFDPMMVYGICVLLCAGAGWVVAPSIGSTAWRMLNRESISYMDALDREFFKHVAKNRVDATLQSATHPIPDYYGESVGSLSQYRQWIRDQNKYRKKNAPLAEE